MYPNNVAFLIKLAVIFFSSIGLIIFAIRGSMTTTKTKYEKWLEEKLRKDPDYIEWLKNNYTKETYKLGLRILKKIRKERLL